jgi:hypothetical protein
MMILPARNPREETSSARGVRRGVSKGVEDGHRLPALLAATPETAVRLFQELPARRA